MFANEEDNDEEGEAKCNEFVRRKVISIEKSLSTFFSLGILPPCVLCIHLCLNMHFL